jgi:hydroxymethylglutaryl-CoA synthase
MKETIGIDCLSFYVPPLYLPLAELASERNLEYAKLNKGLGLESMALCDVDEDAATMAAQAALRLIQDFNLEPAHIGRIYVGTESALDAAKPTATYVLQMLEQALAGKYGPRCLKNCDALDMTFACVGGVDAMMTCKDWVMAGENRVALVIATDIAKYALQSTGEYTQGAGAVALTIKRNPRLLALSTHTGIATEAVGDFFKPRRHFPKEQLLQEAAQLLGTSLSSDDAQHLLEHNTSPFWSDPSATIEVHKDEPVFDGPYSNNCYQHRIAEALEHFTTQVGHVDVLTEWHHLVFHLPYAFQGRRMLTEQWLKWMLASNQQAETLAALNLSRAPEPDTQGWTEAVKMASKSALYQNFVQNRIAPGEHASSAIGNLYTASIFMSLISLLRTAYNEQQSIHGNTIGFFAYGSGSKSKVFTATVMPEWKEVIAKNDVFSQLEERTAVTFAQYEALHRGVQKTPLYAAKKIALESIGTHGNKQGYRTYKIQ